MSDVVVLVAAKAPRAGQVKTRLAADLGSRRGAETAARLAAAALLDTFDACEAAFGAHRCHLALEGDLAGSAESQAIARRLATWRVLPQRGRGLGARLAAAHADVFAWTGLPVVQIGMDTPHAEPETLRGAARSLSDVDAVLGPADDGGWWLLALRHPRHSARLAEVPMSTAHTGALTRRMLVGSGARVLDGPSMRDIDTGRDAVHVAGLAPRLRFSRAWRDAEGAR